MAYGAGPMDLFDVMKCKYNYDRGSCMKARHLN